MLYVSGGQPLHVVVAYDLGCSGFSCGPIPPGAVITATATVGPNTSEYGPWITFTNTAPGTPPPLVNLYDDSQQLRSSVQFNAVYSPGNTFLNRTTPPLSPNPTTWNVGQTPAYWDISTDATYSGSVHVCLYYNESEVPQPENMLRLLHYQNGTWMDVTDTVDPAANRICGTASSLSPFVLATPAGTSAVGDNPVPTEFALRANTPNPFNSETTIEYDVRNGGVDVLISILDVSGRLVRTLVDDHRDAGRYSTWWNGTNERGGPVSPGVYFYRMQAGPFTATRKMVLYR
jgi:hypothetical protein